jgi:hypothetical protein
MSYPLEKFDQLPKWARDEIMALRIRLDEARSRIATLIGDDKSRVFVKSMDWREGKERPLGDDATVSFRLSEANQVDAHIDDNVGAVYVSTAKGSIIARPIASNCIYISVRDR